VQLAVDGFSPAVLVLPDRLDAPRPVLIAAHGAGDGPEWQCETWQAIVRGRGFILCPRGVRLNADPSAPSGYFYRNHFTLEREVLAAVAALKRAYAREADTSAIVYTGYSQGATMGVLMLVGHAEQFPRLILVEGGNGDFSGAIARRYKEGGGVRVLFACGGAHCNGRAQRSAHALNAQQVEARVAYAPGAGHTYGGAVAERVAQAFDWVVAGDARWNVR
jgi:predicted esterase